LGGFFIDTPTDRCGRQQREITSSLRQLVRQPSVLLQLERLPLVLQQLEPQPLVEIAHCRIDKTS